MSRLLPETGAHPFGKIRHCCADIWASTVAAVRMFVAIFPWETLLAMAKMLVYVFLRPSCCRLSRYVTAHDGLSAHMCSLYHVRLGESDT